MHNSTDKNNATIISEFLEIASNSRNLREANGLLTTYMANRTIQALIKDENLPVIVNAVTEMAHRADGEYIDNYLLASAMLGRLSAVARAREDQVFARIDELLEEELPSIETLADGDEKYYAAITISQSSEPWVLDYSASEVFRIESSEKARKSLIGKVLSDTGNLSDFLSTLSENLNTVKSITDVDKRNKRIRRILVAIQESIDLWRGDCGENPGAALSEFSRLLVGSNIAEAEVDVAADIANHLFSILTHIINLRFSHAFAATTYEVITSLKRIAGPAQWNNILSRSTVLPMLRNQIAEAAVVLAKQDKTDSDFLPYLNAVYSSSSQIELGLASHFDSHKEIGADVREWWLSSGSSEGGKPAKRQRVGNSEDQQIGSIILELDSLRESLEKVERAIVPLLDIQDPVLAETLKKVSGGFTNIAQIARRLGRMRKLTTTQLKDQEVEYNPRQHDMLGGHKSGIRVVKVVRDGIQKEFGGKVKMLVKCWVTPVGRSNEDNE
ncbi:MAG: hypothetical protein RKH07_01965 [Gammaproteobacteria bacterium]